MPSVVSKIKDAMHGGRDNHPYEDDYETGRHDTIDTERDRYAGTASHESSHVPGSFPGTSYDEPSSHHADGRKYVAPHGTHVGHGHSGREVTDSDQLMDPASEGTGSNVLGDAEAGTTGLHGTQHTGGNKLHRQDDPRGYKSSDYSSALPSSGQHQGEGHHLRENLAERDSRQGYGGGTLSSQNQPHTLHHQSGQEHIGNTTTTTTSTHIPHGHNDTRQKYPDNSSQQDHQRHNPATSGAATATGGAAVGGLAASQLTDHSRHHDESSRHATGAQQQPLDPTSGRIDQRDYAAGGSDGRGGGVYNTVVGRGSRDGQHEQHGQHQHTSRGAEDLTSRNHDSHTGILPGQNGGKSGAIPREAGDSRITSGAGAHDATTGSGRHAFDTSFTQPHNQGPMARDSTAASIGAGALGSGQGALPGGGSLGPHSNAKVMHKCVGCGLDNDISHYFKKDLVYRIDHQ